MAARKRLRQDGPGELDTLRTPPHSIEAEQAVLGGLLLDATAWDQVGDFAAYDRFTRAWLAEVQTRWPVFNVREDLALALRRLPIDHTVGAGLLGFAINPPASLYYVQGLNMTAAHGHAAHEFVGQVAATGLQVHLTVEGALQSRIQ